MKHYGIFKFNTAFPVHYETYKKSQPYMKRA